MRKKTVNNSSNFNIIVLDDEEGIIDSLEVVLTRSGYNFVGETDPIKAVQMIKDDHFDMLILDYLMYPIHGDEVVRRIREFNSELYILLLTGHQDIAPPLETIRMLEIQGYSEKSDKFDQLILLVESGIKSITMMQTIKKFQEGLNKILLSVPKIYQLQPLGTILEEILVEIMPLVNSENAFILIDDITDNDSTNKSIFTGIGKYKTEVTDFIESLGPQLMETIGHARMTREMVEFEKSVIIPLNNEYLQSIGVICVESIDAGTFHKEDAKKLLGIYANQASSSLNNAFLHSLVNMKNNELNKTYDQLRGSYMDTIEALRLAVDAKDIYTRGHSDRVSYYAVKIGEELGISYDELEMLRISGIFHDVGKIGTADDILLKNQSLNIHEYEEIKKHPLKGAHILSAVSMFKGVVDIVKYHHERIDGLGYPEGIRGTRIPLLSRIVSIADAFDSMVSDRQYRSRLALEDAKTQLIQGKDTQFDGKIVDVFLVILKDYEILAQEVSSTYLPSANPHIKSVQ